MMRLTQVPDPDVLPDAVRFEDFYALAPENKFIFAPNGSLWPAKTVDSRLPIIGKIAPSKRLHIERPVEDMSWAPGAPRLIRHKLPVEAGWIDHPNATVFNLYQPPRIKGGDPTKAQPWIDHVYKVYPDDGERIIRWLAFRVQSPEIKINHCLVLGGEAGIGKDTLLYPVVYAVGPWNVAVVSPVAILSRFCGWKRNVLLIVSEARDLGEATRPAFYEHMKDLLASPPEMLRVDEKNRKEYWIANLVGVVITSNHKVGGLFLPEQDRRHDVCWSPLAAKSPGIEYFDQLYHWFDYENGIEHVAALLETYDVSDFNPKAPPPQTPAFWEIAVASVPGQVTEIEDAIEGLGSPDLLVIPDLISVTSLTPGDTVAMLQDQANRHMLPRWMEAAGYVAVRNLNAKNGKWRIRAYGGKKLMVYGKKTISPNVLTKMATAKYS
jgi:hypothetical protein